MDPVELLWFIPIGIAIAYIAEVAEGGSHMGSRIRVPGVIQFAYFALSSVFNLYIAKELFYNTKLDTNYDSHKNLQCTIGFLRKLPGMEVEVTRSKVESVEIAMLLLFGSKFLRFLDSFTLLSRVTNKVSVKLSHQSIICREGAIFSGRHDNIRHSSSHGHGKNLKFY